MKLFLWENVLHDYGAGIAFALAKTEDEARELIIEKFSQKYDPNELYEDLQGPPRVVEDKEGFYMWGSA